MVGEPKEFGGPRDILLSYFQGELERVAQLASAQGWTGGWGEAWLWLSAHQVDSNDTGTWRWDWVERPRDGGHISGARLEGTSGKKVIPDPRFFGKIGNMSLTSLIFSGGRKLLPCRRALIQAATGRRLPNKNLVW